MAKEVLSGKSKGLSQAGEKWAAGMWVNAVMPTATTASSCTPAIGVWTWADISMPRYATAVVRAIRRHPSTVTAAVGA
ncbi:hypothetical protein [Streptomyces sp. NPDC057580]|uniref:hypothetical protein n=1 Tax=Streptomyces sp. NPDC057580 TaxID=3346173 RepID=UPI0036A54731